MASDKVLWEVDKGCIDMDLEGDSWEPEEMIAHLLINSVVYFNNNWWEKEWPDQAREAWSMHVNCNDVFAWGCADGEDIQYKEVRDLYKMWQKDPVWGPAVWCMQKRKLMPQNPVYDRIQKAGIWDLDKMGLCPNNQQCFIKGCKIHQPKGK